MVEKTDGLDCQWQCDDITSSDDMKKALQAHFSPQDETWEARMKIKFINGLTKLKKSVGC